MTIKNKYAGGGGGHYALAFVAMDRGSVG